MTALSSGTPSDMSAGVRLVTKCTHFHGQTLVKGNMLVTTNYCK